MTLQKNLQRTLPKNTNPAADYYPTSSSRIIASYLITLTLPSSYQRQYFYHEQENSRTFYS